MSILENLAGFASLVTAVIAAMSFGWRWHTTPPDERSRFIDVLDVAVLLIATLAAAFSLCNVMHGHLESIILAAWLGFGVALASVILSALAVFKLREGRTKRATKTSESTATASES